VYQIYARKKNTSNRFANRFQGSKMGFGEKNQCRDRCREGVGIEKDQRHSGSENRHKGYDRQDEMKDQHGKNLMKGVHVFFHQNGNTSCNDP